MHGDLRTILKLSMDGATRPKAVWYNTARLNNTSSVDRSAVLSVISSPTAHNVYITWYCTGRIYLSDMMFTSATDDPRHCCITNNHQDILL